MNKFGRNYQLGVTDEDGTVKNIALPFTVEFEIYRNSFSSANIGSFRIYNLAPMTRSNLRKDQYDFDTVRPIAFKAGYGNNLGLAFAGFITQAWSVREGVNTITQIECFDGGYAFQTSVTNLTLPEGTPYKPTPGLNEPSVLGAMINNLPGVSIGAVGDYPGSLPRGNAYSGATTDLLQQITGQGFFIDNNVANCLNDTECLEGNPPVVSADTGLLGTPVKEQTHITFTMLFEPSLKIGQLLTLNSKTAGVFNGTHKVISIRHRGTISAAVCGDATTEVGLLPNGQGPFTPVPSAAQ